MIATDSYVNVKPVDLNEWVYSVLRQRILENQYSPDSQLHIENLVEELSVSRTPIREALLRLRMEGLVRSESRVGFFVQGISEKDFEELFELRSLIECYAAEKAAKHISETDIRRLREAQEKGKNAVLHKEYEMFNTYETEIHDIIISYLDNTRISNTLVTVKDTIYRQRLLSMNDVNNVLQSVEEHEKLIEAICNLNSKEAYEVMQWHIKNVEKRLLKFLND